MSLEEIILDGTGNRQLGTSDYILDAPGLLGVARVVGPSAGQTRAALGLSEPVLADAFTQSDIRLKDLFELEITDDVQPAASHARTRSTGEAAILLYGPATSDTVGQAVLYSDEAGILQWVFPEPVIGQQYRVVYRIPRSSPPADRTNPEVQRRGAVIKQARRVVRVLIWPLAARTTPAIRSLVRTLENTVRHAGWQMLPFTSLSTPEWGWLRKGRTLLFLHGTMSTAEQAFGGLHRDTLLRLREHYSDRIIAFNHPSLHVHPSDNVAEMLRTLPDGIELDIVAHSRGGLVARDLIRQVAALQRNGHTIRVHTAVLVGVPNRGTPLVHTDHMLEFLDRTTNLLAQAPDTVLSIALEGVLTLAKVVAYLTVDALPGLQAMLPDGDYLRELNHTPPTSVQYRALVADYQPTDVGWVRRFRTRLAHGIFDEPNDGIVPTVGGYSATRDGSGWTIAPEHRRVFEATEGVSHSTFFGHPVVNTALLEWLAQPQ